MKRFTITRKNAPLNFALESDRTLDNGVVLKLIHCGSTMTVTAVYKKELETYEGLRTTAEAAYIEDYLKRKYDGVSADDLPMLTA